MWTGLIYMGKWTPMNVVFDTGSDWLMVESYLCWNCEGRGNSTGEVYNTTKSIMVDPENTEKLQQRIYGEVFLSGFEYTDKVCISISDGCVNDFKYFGILKQEGLVEPVDGVLGMARSHPRSQADQDAKSPAGSLFVDAMVAEGLIDENVFTFKVDQAGDSEVMFGNPTGIKDIQWLQAYNDFFWSFDNSLVAFGSIENAYSY